ncbi:putative fructosyl amino acid oxidasesarcosine oxidase [Xylariaceae sp. FL0016]|nr:putative fructosyl amino acid oxidasesarcosine oxidase [Xylariaceae sp. FL0016]
MTTLAQLCSKRRLSHPAVVIEKPVNLIIMPQISTVVPESILIIGGGVFGLSTALAIARRQPATHITIVDRLTPPVPDGSSVDTTRCIRADYADPIYADLAAEAQQRIEEDPDLQKHYFKKGMSFVCDGEPGRFHDIWTKGLENVRSRQTLDTLVEMRTRKEVFARIHGNDLEPVPEAELTRPARWNQGYCNLEDAFIDAEESIKVYYDRCCAQESITFRCGSAVDRIICRDGVAIGIVLEDDQELQADVVLVAAGSWSSKLVHLEDLMYSTAIEVAWVKVTPAEAEKWKCMSITTNLSTGFNIFPPHNGEIKMLRRSAGYCNTITVSHPEQSGKSIAISYPRTKVTHPTDVIPQEAEDALRDNLRELMPSLASRPFDRTKLCWLSQTPSADFIICPHPHIKGLHVATGGSAHAWKFLPSIGDLVLDSMLGVLREDLTEKWKWDKGGRDGGNAPRMNGRAKELRDVVR